METDAAKSVSKLESDDEEILIEFPTELIPDEYEHENNANGLVYLFGDKGGKQMSGLLFDGLGHHGYYIPNENQFEISDKDKLIAKLKELADGDFTNKSCLIITIMAENFIFKQLLVHETISKVWSPFMENKTLKYKPKVFFFYEYEEKSDIATDSQISFTNDMEKAYDVPSEADVLIVYQRSINVSIKKKDFGFLDEFCKNLKEYGKRDDLVGILTRSEHEERPLIISTLRKKFYVSSSRFREHFYDIQSNNINILESLETLRDKFTKTGRAVPGSSPQDAMETDSSTSKPSTSSGKVRKSHTVTDGPSKKLSVGIAAKKDKSPARNERRKSWRN